MNTDHRPLAAPKDNLLGICNAMGEDFGFNPLWLRLALGAAFVIQPVGVVATYLALGLTVLVARLAFPKAKVRSIAPVDADRVDQVIADYDEPEYAKPVTFTGLGRIHVMPHATGRRIPQKGEKSV